MNSRTCSVLTGSGKYIPTRTVKNEAFLEHTFYTVAGQPVEKSNQETISKFQQITDIIERRYAGDDYVTSDMGYIAAQQALETADLDREKLDYIVVAHNFGDVKASNRKSDMVPSLAARIKYRLGIANPRTVAYDLPFGCPGWLQGLIQVDSFFRAGDGTRGLIIGAETLSRVSDPHDVDSMIYSDGAGAVVLEARECAEPAGLLGASTRCDTLNHYHLLRMDRSYDPAEDPNKIYLKMEGRKVYEYAVTTVPLVVKDCLDKAGLHLRDVDKVLIHQANAKMDHAILARLFKLYGQGEVPEDIMPLTIDTLGNNSVATLPILYDMTVRGELARHRLDAGSCFVLASVGAGMNINAAVYRIP